MQQGRGVMVGLLAVVSAGGCADEPTTVVLQIEGTALVALQDGDGPWETVVPDATGRAEIEVASGRYGLAHLCNYSSSYHTTLEYSTAPATRTVDCGRTFTDFVRLSGVTSPEAEVFVDSDSVGVDAAGTYVKSLIPGRHDVFAILPGAPARVLVERAVDLSTDRTLDLPVAANGLAMATMTPTVRGATGPVSVYADLNTATNGYVVFGMDPTTVPVPPASILIAGDQPAIGASSGGCTVQQPLRAEPPTLDIPGPFAAQIDRSVATWQADSQVDWAFLRFELTSFVPRPGTFSDIIRLMAFADQEWIEAAGAAGAITLPDLADLPGWQSAGATFASGYDVEWALSIAQGQPQSDYRACSQSGTLRW